MGWKIKCHRRLCATVLVYFHNKVEEVVKNAPVHHCIWYLVSFSLNGNESFTELVQVVLPNTLFLVVVSNGITTKDFKIFSKDVGHFNLFVSRSSTGN